MLKVINLTKKFNNHTVLNQVMLKVDSEIKVMIGLNGSGKSTLLKVIAGILNADSGRVLINNTDVSKLSPEERNVGYVPQHPALFNHLTILENIKYCTKNGRGSEEIFNKIVRMLDLKEILNKKPFELSGGFKSRASLARALTSQPKIMLLDEPLSDIDVAIKEKLLPEFRKVLKTFEIPVLYVTHDPWEANLLGDGFLVIVNGKVRAINSAKEAFEVVKSSLYFFRGQA